MYIYQLFSRVYGWFSYDVVHACCMQVASPLNMLCRKAKYPELRAEFARELLERGVSMEHRDQEEVRFHP